MKNLKQLLFFAVIAVFLASCSNKAPELVQYIPKNASSVVVVNTKSLDDKLKTGNLSLDTLISKIERSTGNTMTDADKKIWSNFKNSGINFEENFYMFMVQKASMTKGTVNITNMLGSLKDATKFEKFLSDLDTVNKIAFEKQNNFTYATYNNIAFAWNKSIVLVNNYSKDIKPSFDSLGVYQVPDTTGNAKDQKEEVAKYFNLKENEQIGSIASFKDMFKQKADAYVFTTTASALAYLSISPLNLPKLNDLLQDNYSVTYINFEDGKITANGSAYTNPFLSSILKKYTGSTINIDALQKYPSENMNGFLQFSFNPEMLNAILKELELSGLVDTYLSTQKLTSADVIKALKGEINLFVSDFAIEEREASRPDMNGKMYSYKKTIPSAKMLFTAKIGDKAAFNTIMEKAVQAGIAIKTPTGYSAGTMLTFLKMYLTVDAENFIISTDEATYKAYAAGNAKSNISSDIINKVKGKSSAGYINANSLFTTALKNISDTTSKKVLTLLNNNIKDANFTADNFDGKTIKSNAELTMVNNKQNSLVTWCNLLLDVLSIVEVEKSQKDTFNSNNNLPPLNNGPSSLE